ncbi:GNAT family N-acetyltransferase [Lacticaseibacillus hulanensis]|uniref:GNAT family N-acetyltransferase n=1 Tax=Lacticaseibacillus hulanensis TaxID=2493111 RepID=UPI000FD7EC85|nr:GNAT family N-acetyltransferase [Lacticaseibacillus hulanensis]
MQQDDEVRIQRVTSANAQALKLPNEPFPLIGRMVVERTSGSWTHREMMFEEETVQTFPDEDYELGDIDAAGFALAAFAQSDCVGLATFADRWNKYLYLDDLKVNSAWRGHGVATALLDAARAEATKRGYRGLTTIAQDNNLWANRFYQHYGFVIGGLNTADYNFTQQAGKADIYYYYNFN